MGKVHGSLARAGKVKGQTPKVRNPEIATTAVHEPDGNGYDIKKRWIAKCSI